MASLGLSKAELREAIAELLSYLASGYDDSEARTELGLDPEQYAALKRELYSQQAEYYRTRTREDLYTDYINEQRACIHELDKITTRFADDKNASAAVGAIRARSDIVDKIVKLGQDIGLVQKEPDKKVVLGGVAVAALSDAQLRKAIVGEVAALDRLIAEFGDGVSIVDMDPGSLHRPVKALASGGKTSGGTSAKVSGGRRVVKS
jgi:hypothetical protein